MRPPNPPTPDNIDLQWLRRMQQSVNARTLLPGKGYRIKRSTQGTILQIDPGSSSSSEIFHPFKIYNSPGTLLKSGETGVDVYNGGALPTADDGWRCFAVRGGIIEARPQYVVSAPNIWGDNEYLLGVERGDDGVVRLKNKDYFSNSTNLDVFSSTLNVKLETVNIPNSGDVSVTNETGGAGDELPHAARFVLNGDLDAVLEIHASFWIEVTDDTPGDLPKCKIKARMWSNVPGGTGRTTTAFPNGRNIIPIGTINSNYSADDESEDATAAHKMLAPINYIDDHILNRRLFAQLGNGFLDYAALGPTYWRGQLFFDGATFTDVWSITNTVFYPGDLVTISYPAPSSISTDFAGYMVLYIYAPGSGLPAVVTDFSDPFTAGFVQIAGLVPV